ncbi:ribonuclease CAF1 [Cantharellus anzutake]|uniref:ribonuclease CAF1 n=1 Tax=Cantharellus anzutake TaxID=1750568 RepID=UPI00190715C1|nr:ribonuclease CAF1 [Cantharellus anzutake]KAF8340474.1 ribonuclease CAF1 [Cantharellus anzutake]
MASTSTFREVWATNLEQEFAEIRRLIDSYPYVAMDTEFPGVVARPIGNFQASSDYLYQTMRCNVDLLKMIQIGFTLSDTEGNHPPDVSTWQFNFHFSLNEDMYAPDSYELLRNAGLDFTRHEEFGIYPNDFAELIITSGLVLNDEVKWITYHSGYDFGYLLKILTGAPLPLNESDFHSILSIWFPAIFDVKYIHKQLDKSFKGGLKDVADQLQVSRVGEQHQAGSDSLLTSATFFKMRQTLFQPGGFDEKTYR